MPIVCRTEDIKGGTGKEVHIAGDQGGVWLMLFIHKGEVLAFHNTCPHQGRALNFAPDRFILSKEQQLVCPHHGATFDLDSGLCVAGPCKGSFLKAVEVTVVDGEVSVQGS